MEMEAVVTLRTSSGTPSQVDAERTDVDLSRRAVAGDADAFELLCRRHAEAAWRVAQAVTPNADGASEAVSEGFTRVLRAVAEGRARPDIAFRPYLLATTRNAAIDEPPADEPAGPDAADQSVEPSAGLAGTAFRSLPERWRSMLWITDVEGVPVRDVSERLGLSVPAATQLARRARAGFRERYLAAHLQSPLPKACATTLGGLGAYADGSLDPAAMAAIDQHLAGCDTCAGRAEEVTDLGERLRPIALAVPAGLAALAFARYREAFASSQARRPLAIGTLDLTRPLTVATTSLLALGVIAAGLISGGGGPAAVAGARSGGTAGKVPTILTQLAGSGGPAPSGGTTAGSNGLNLAISLNGTPATPPAPSSVTLPTATTTPTTTPTGGNPGGVVVPPTVPPTGSQPPPSSSPGGDALLQLELGANVGGTSVGTSVGAGGGCTGVSVNGSSSCAAGAAPTSGINVGLATPVGPVVIDVPGPTTTTTPPPAKAKASAKASTPVITAKVGGTSLSA